MSSRESRVLLLDVLDFDLSVRAYNVLADLEIQTPSDLARLDTKKLLRRQRNCGQKTVAELEELARFLSVRLGSAGGSVARKAPEFCGKRVALSDGDFPVAWLLRVDAVPLPWRASRGLRRLGCQFLGDIATMRPSATLEQSQYGRRTLREIIDMFAPYGAFLGLDAEGWSQADPRALAKEYESELHSIREELLVRKFGRDLLTCSFVEEDVRVALSKCGGRCFVERVMAWIGFHKDRDPTAAEVADRAFVSKGRIGQILHVAEIKLDRYGLPTPTIDRAIQSIEQTLPARADRVEAKLREAGLIREGTRARGVLRAARLFRANVNVESRRAGSRDFWIRSEDTILELILSEAKRAVERVGLARIQDVATSVSDLTGRDGFSTLTEDFLTALDGFSWLDQQGGWFWFPGKRRNRLRQRIEKILAVAGRIELIELRAGIARDGNQRNNPPPTDVLHQFCEQLPDCAVVPGSDDVRDTGARNIQRVLSVSEQRILRIFDEFGPVMEKAEIVSRATRAGIKRPTVEAVIARSPILLRLDAGVYRIIGCCQAQVER